MSKESRQRARENARRASSGSAANRPAAGEDVGVESVATPRPSTSPTGSARVGRRERSRPVRKISFFERYRTLIVGAAVVAIVGLVGVGLFSAATTPAYACSTNWEPTPTASPGANASPQPGYPQPDMGNQHVGAGTRVTFTYCPPASGRHYPQPQAPITARLYGPDDIVGPTGWVHNLEHGGIVILYRGDSEGATDAGQASLRSLFDSYPPSPVCGFERGTNGPVIARFDDMAWPFAAVVWGRVLPLQSLDQEAIIDFDQAFGERTNPEQFCQPTPAPTISPSASAAPSASVAPSATAVPSVSAAPSASPDPS